MLKKYAVICVEKKKGKKTYVLFNQDSLEVVDDMVFDSEEDAEMYINEIHSAMLEGEEVMRLRREWEETDPEENYGYGSDDLVLQVDIDD